MADNNQSLEGGDAGRAWWSGSGTALLAAEPDAIIGQLAHRLVRAFSQNRAEQLDAWRLQIALLKAALQGQAWARCQVLLEYPLLRLQRRIDTVILTERAIFCIEFKLGGTAFSRTDREQVDDYALDLYDFHAASRRHPIVPILVATAARCTPPKLPLLWHSLNDVLEANAASFSPLLQDITVRLPEPTHPLDIEGWEAAPYHPVPTIVEAATMLYTRHGVADIAAARADIGNLTRTTSTLHAVLQATRAKGGHAIAFVTGIPGAGKTLCGLQCVFGADTGAAFLTGNLPLVHVLREALARDARDNQGRTMRVARHEAESAIQPLMGFLRDNLPRQSPPHEHVIVFDEAQRAWDAAYGRRKFGHDASEAALFLDIMRRHQEHAVIIALVGNGQEINTGEAGLGEWARALAQRPEWQVHAPPGVLTAANPRQRLAPEPPNLVTASSLQLDVPIRSIRSSTGAPWVEAVLAGDIPAAAAIAAEPGLPFALTRSLPALRAALRARVRGTRRAGLVCSAGAKRLRADGLWPEFPHLDANVVADWFLNRWPDVRASDALELPATQFACQGLELDFVGLCWGGDLVRMPGRGSWSARKFRGSRWVTQRHTDAVAFCLNTYRVLLTRARYETIIWVPEGDADDITRAPSELNAVAEFLLACGAPALDHTPTPTPEAEPVLL